MNRVLLFQSHSHNFFGGGEHSLLALMKEALNRGYDVHLIVPGPGAFQQRARLSGINVHIIKSYWWTYNNRNEFEPKRNKLAVKRTERLISEIKPSVCITNTITMPWLAIAANNQKTPHVWILREYGDVDHGLQFWLSMKDIGNIISGLSDKIFTNSEELKKHYQKLCRRKDIGIITPSVDRPKVTSTVDPFRSDVIKLVCVGNLSYGKGQIDAVKATQQLVASGHDVQLILVGLAAEEDYKRRVEQYIDDNDLQKHISLVGYQDNPANFVAFADFNLVCSKNETFGRVTIESLLLNTPVIGTRSGNTKELLGNNERLLYTFGSAEELAARILALKDSKQVGLILEKLQANIRKRYSPDKAHMEFFAYLEKAHFNDRSGTHSIRKIQSVLSKQKSRGVLTKTILRIGRLARRFSPNQNVST